MVRNRINTPKPSFEAKKNKDLLTEAEYAAKADIDVPVEPAIEYKTSVKESDIVKPNAKLQDNTEVEDYGYNGNDALTRGLIEKELGEDEGTASLVSGRADLVKYPIKDFEDKANIQWSDEDKQPTSQPIYEYVWNSWDDGVKSEITRIVGEANTIPQTNTNAQGGGDNTATNAVSGANSTSEGLTNGVKSANEKTKADFEELKKRLGKNQSIYEALVQDSIKKRMELATRKERNARSQSLANALGTIVNVITAGAMGAKGGYAPIVSDYDKTYDSVLRKSIEDRYAIENENEGLLMQLAGERRKHEDELASKGFDVNMAISDRDVAAQTAIYKSEMAKADKEAEREWKATQAKLEREHQASESEKQRKHDAEQKEKDRKSRIRQSQIAASGAITAAKLRAQNNLTGGQATFILGVAQGRQETRVSLNQYGMPTTTTGEANISSNDVKALALIYNRLVGAGLDATQMDKAMATYRTIWQRNPSEAMSEDSFNKALKAAGK